MYLDVARRMIKGKSVYNEPAKTGVYNEPAKTGSKQTYATAETNKKGTKLEDGNEYDSTTETKALDTYYAGEAAKSNGTEEYEKLHLKKSYIYPDLKDESAEGVYDA